MAVLEIKSNEKVRFMQLATYCRPTA